MGKPEICASFIYENEERGMQIPPDSYKRKSLNKEDGFIEIPLEGKVKTRARKATKGQEIE